MRHSVFILLLLITTTLAGQTAKDADKERERLKGASFPKPIKKMRILFFSDTKKKDTIILTIPIGSISKSSSSLIIKTADNRTIFSENFRTDYFVRGVFEPDTTPQGGHEIYDAYMNKYITSLTKSKIEVYAKTEINSFLKDFTVSKKELKQAKSYGALVDKGLYKTIIANPNSKVIWLPCFDCDEGVRYFGYSTKRAKAVQFLETD